MYNELSEVGYTNPSNTSITSVISSIMFYFLFVIISRTDTHSLKSLAFATLIKLWIITQVPRDSFSVFVFLQKTCFFLWIVFSDIWQAYKTFYTVSINDVPMYLRVFAKTEKGGERWVIYFYVWNAISYFTLKLIECIIDLIAENAHNLQV